MNPLPLFVAWCALLLLCWFAAVTLALLYSTGVWLARWRGVWRRLVSMQPPELQFY